MKSYNYVIANEESIWDYKRERNEKMKLQKDELHNLYSSPNTAGQLNQ
jgi:hypothetical protein